VKNVRMPALSLSLSNSLSLSLCLLFGLIYMPAESSIGPHNAHAKLTFTVVIVRFSDSDSNFNSDLVSDLDSVSDSYSVFEFGVYFGIVKVT